MIARAKREKGAEALFLPFTLVQDAGGIVGSGLTTNSSVGLWILIALGAFDDGRGKKRGSTYLDDQSCAIHRLARLVLPSSTVCSRWALTN